LTRGQSAALNAAIGSKPGGLFSALSLSTPQHLNDLEWIQDAYRLSRKDGVRWSRLFEQLFRFDKWNVCRG